jgi:predicted transposase YbfD/YdcC
MARKSGKLGSIQDTLKSLNIKLTDIKQNDEFINELIRNAKTVPDYRHSSYIRHSLVDILVISLLAVLADNDEWEEIADFAKQKEKWLKRYLELPNGVPSSDTIRIVISSIDTKHFYQSMIHTLMLVIDKAGDAIINQEEHKDIVSMDGKESKGSKRKLSDKEDVCALHTLNLYSSDYGFCLGQEFIKEKSNEIPAGPLLLEQLDLKNCVVTWDALNTQTQTVAAVIRGKGDYVAALKGNHPLFYKEVTEFFSEEELENLQKNDQTYKKTMEKEQGCIAVREYYQTKEVGWYTDRKKWEGLKSFGMVKKTMISSNGEKREERRYYLSSIEQDIELFERASRGHWAWRTYYIGIWILHLKMIETQQWKKQV